MTLTEIEAIRARWAMPRNAVTHTEFIALHKAAKADIATLLSALSAARARVTTLEAELKVTETLLIERQKVLDAIPECRSHGACVPHALEWIEAAKKAQV